MKKPFFALWILTLALFIFSWVYLPGISKYRDLTIKQEQIENEIKVLDEKLKSVREERDLLKNDVQYLEKVIRDELGLVKPGEVVYKFVPEQAAPAPKTEEAPATPAIVPPGAPAPKPATAKNPNIETIEVPAISIQQLDQAAEGQLPTPIVTPETRSDDDDLDIAASGPLTDEEPVYPRREIR